MNDSETKNKHFDFFFYISDFILFVWLILICVPNTLSVVFVADTYRGMLYEAYLQGSFRLQRLVTQASLVVNGGYACEGHCTWYSD